MKKHPDKNAWDKKRLFIEVMSAFIICLIGIKYGEQKSVINYNGNVITYQIYQDVIKSIDEANESLGESINGQNIADYAEKFVNAPYVYGGVGLTTGVDSSGFVQTIFKHFGFVVPRTIEGMKSIGEEVIIAKAKAGDIICMQNAVGIYLGNNQYIYSSQTAGKVVITDINDAAIVSVRRVVQ